VTTEPLVDKATVAHIFAILQDKTIMMAEKYYFPMVIYENMIEA
jgi:hypothetical protein